MKSLIFSLILGLFFSYAAQAESVRSKNPLDRNGEIKKIAREKTYPGGRDEEPLKVQSQLANPTRKAVSVPGMNQAEAEDSDTQQHD